MAKAGRGKRAVSDPPCLCAPGHEMSDGALNPDRPREGNCGVWLSSSKLPTAWISALTTSV